MYRVQYLFSAIFFSIFFNAQKIEISPKFIAEYEFEFQADSTKLKSPAKELMSLYIDDNVSLFESNIRTYIDSLENNYHGGMINMEQIPNQKISIGIYKNSKENKYIFYDEKFRLKLKYEFSPMKWELLKEEKKIGPYECNLAKTYYGGRVWYAWYAKEIPIHDGPYKFYGLPGLIISINDKNNYFKFNLIRVYKKELSVKRRISDFVNVNKKDYYKTKRIFFEKEFGSRLKFTVNPIEVDPE